MGDFTKGKLPPDLSPELVMGIQLHRSIDGFTDAHPAVVKSKRLFSSPGRRYAGVALDVFYDHLLLKHWDDFSPQLQVAKDADGFIQEMYILLNDHVEIMPETMGERVQMMIRFDLFRSYQKLSGVERALHKMSTRVKRGEYLLLAAELLQSHYAELEREYLKFFPTLIEHVRGQSS